jgi:hypothetical protein
MFNWTYFLSLRNTLKNIPRRKPGFSGFPAKAVRRAAALPLLRRGDRRNVLFEYDAPLIPYANGRGTVRRLNLMFNVVYFFIQRLFQNCNTGSNFLKKVKKIEKRLTETI